MSPCKCRKPNPLRISYGLSSRLLVVVVVVVKWYSTAHQSIFEGRCPCTPSILLLLVQCCEKLGAGEILLNCVDRDGQKDGFDLVLVKVMFLGLGLGLGLGSIIFQLVNV